MKAESYGFPPETRLALDIEPGPTGASVVAYAQAWAGAVRQAGYAPGLYAVLDLHNPTGSLCNQAGDSFDWVWVAAGVNFEPTSPDVPGLTTCRGRRAWQYWGTHTEQGVSVDRGVADDWFLTREEDPMFGFTDPKNGCKVLCDQTGAVFNFNPDGTVGGHYLGGLNNHPEWHAGGGEANGPAIAIQPWDDGNPALSGYVIITRDLAGQFHPYQFPSSGVLAAAGLELSLTDARVGASPNSLVQEMRSCLDTLERALGSPAALS
jgi:hypothetical protein